MVVRRCLPRLNIIRKLSTGDTVLLLRMTYILSKLGKILYLPKHVAGPVISAARNALSTYKAVVR